MKCFLFLSIAWLNFVLSGTRNDVDTMSSTIFLGTEVLVLDMALLYDLGEHQDKLVNNEQFGAGIPAASSK